MTFKNSEVLCDQFYHVNETIMTRILDIDGIYFRIYISNKKINHNDIEYILHQFDRKSK